MSPQQVSIDAEDFWEDLLAYIEEQRVIPVVGAELLTIELDGRTTVLYRAVAEQLLARYDLSADALPGGAVLREHHELNDAVSALAATGIKPVKDLYRPIHDIIQRLVAAQTEPLPVLRELASISGFDLFATTTPDGLLARALESVRNPGTLATDQIEYAPSLPTNRRRDIPEILQSDYRAVFYLFGKVDVSQFYAIHDEDALEFAYTLQYTLQNGAPPARMFSELRNRSLLLIGCNFAAWLSRFFLRLSNEKRLSDNRLKQEILVDRATGEDGNLTVFLERFSRDSHFYPMPARDFVAELYRRWTERHPVATPNENGEEGVAPVPAGGGAIFISYASEDVAAARQLYEQLNQIGGDPYTTWIDKEKLRPGDDWDRHIRTAIQRCDLFLPLISTHTEQRPEGYFRDEWYEAAQRSRRIMGQKFILPVVIDPDFDGSMARYQLVRDEFKAFQFSHAPGGQMSPTLREEITGEIRQLRRGRVA